MGRRIVLDSRPRADFLHGHASGAAHLPIDEWDARAAELPPRNASIFLVGPGLDELRARGYADVHPHLPDESEQGPARAVAWRASSALERCAAFLPTRGRALDVACGAGRETAWLAARGLDAFGIDLLPDALVRAARLARGARELAESAPARPSKETVFICADAEKPLPLRDGAFAVVCGFRYLDRALFARARQWLMPGGYILWQTFTTRTPAEASPRRAAFRLEPGELARLCTEAGFDVREMWQDGFEDGVLATKPA